MKRSILLAILVCGLVGLAHMVVPFSASAYFSDSATDYTVQEGLTAAGKDVFSAEAPTLQVRIGQITQAIVALVGVIFLAMVIFAGITWMTAGEGPKIQKAKDRMVNAVIGLLITVLAYVAVNFIISRVAGLTQPEVVVPAEEVVPVE